MATSNINHKLFPALPHSWSELTWQQLCDCWEVKMHYGGNADVARVAALLTLLRCSVCPNPVREIRTHSGESLYRLRDDDGCIWTVTAREMAYIAKKALPWFDYPYGDPGEKAVEDEKGKIIKPRREPVAGYVSNMRDALILPIEELVIEKTHKHFMLPQVACNNLTWQQYRSLQAVSPQLFDEHISDDDAIDLQAQFLSHCLTPRSIALLDTSGGSIRIRPHYEYRYDAKQADGIAQWFRRKLKDKALCERLTVIFHICLQTYQTALVYYSLTYPLLFNDSKGDTMKDALAGEVGTINTIMKYTGYTEQQQVYDSNIPFVLDILNTMAREAKEIEKLKVKH